MTQTKQNRRAAFLSALSLSLLLSALLLPALGHAQRIVVLGGGAGQQPELVRVVPVQDGEQTQTCCLQAAAPRSPEAERPPAIEVSVFVDSLDLGRLEGRLIDPDVRALSGIDFSSEQMGASGHAPVGGLSYFVTWRPAPWLRLVDIGFSLGGGPVSGRWQRLGSSSFEARPSRILLARLEVGAALELELDSVRLHAGLRGARTHYRMGLEIRHDEIGELGTEVITQGLWEAWASAGIDARVNDHLRVHATYRYGLAGAAEHGVLLGIGITPG
ncbi:MAG: hypothetical protein OEY14_01350 [Myxococcales bacterium]|nr:hypothetical protein [Myxococcales bacterium]